MSRRHWALVVVLVLVNYVVFASLISVIRQNRQAALAVPTATLLPTFTPVPSPTPIKLLPTATPVPTQTATPIPAVTPTTAVPSATDAPTPAFTGPYVAVDVRLNVRSGPGTGYEKIGSIAPDSAVEIIGRNADGDWWQVRYEANTGAVGWISADYGTAHRTDSVPVVATPAPASGSMDEGGQPAGEAPAPATATVVPQAQQYQFSPGGWYVGEPNAAIGQFFGHIKDAASGVMVDGYSVRATCGDYAVLSYPSGPSAVAPDWGAGYYDIVVPNPVTCGWTLQIVEYQCAGSGFDSQCTEFRPLSEAVAVSTDVDKGETIIVADWVKNW